MKFIEKQLAALESIGAGLDHFRRGTSVDARLAVILFDNAIELCTEWSLSPDGSHLERWQQEPKLCAKLQSDREFTAKDLMRIREYRNSLYHHGMAFRPEKKFVEWASTIARTVYGRVFQTSFDHDAKQLPEPYRVEVPGALPSFACTELPRAQIDFLSASTELLQEIRALCDRTNDDVEWLNSPEGVIEEWVLLSELNGKRLARLGEDRAATKLNVALKERRRILNDGVNAVEGDKAMLLRDVCLTATNALREHVKCVSIKNRLTELLGHRFVAEWSEVTFSVDTDSSFDIGRVKIIRSDGKNLDLTLELYDENSRDLLSNSLPLSENVLRLSSVPPEDLIAQLRDHYHEEAVVEGEWQEWIDAFCDPIYDGSVWRALSTEGRALYERLRSAKGESDLAEVVIAHLLFAQRRPRPDTALELAQCVEYALRALDPLRNPPSAIDRLERELKRNDDPDRKRD